MEAKSETKKNLPLESYDLEEQFNKHIASYGYKKAVTKKSKEDDETYRTSLRRQRDKILYTGGFRRLQDKTQVISAMVEGDHRTRLTHTLEVEQIAISIANALRLNVDLVSAIALGHDVGHTPFGHAAERKLNELLEENGGFHHPIQSIRYLWEKYGSKIESVIYEGILLHDSDMFDIDKTKAEKQLCYLKESSYNGIKFDNHVKINEWLNAFPTTLEAQVVVWADKIAYITHDLEDFLRCKAYINLNKNDNTIEEKLCELLSDLIGKEIKSLREYESRDLIRNIISKLIKASVENIISAIAETGNFNQSHVRDKTKMRSTNNETDSQNKKYLNGLLINFDDTYRDKYYSLRKFLDQYYIFSPEVQKSDAKAEYIVEWLFEKLTKNYKLMPLELRNEVDTAIIANLDKHKCLDKIYKGLPATENSVSHLDKAIKDNKDPCIKDCYNSIKNDIISRKVASYIATMSDSYAEGMYRNLIGSSVDFNL